MQAYIPDGPDGVNGVNGPDGKQTSPDALARTRLIIEHDQNNARFNRNSPPIGFTSADDIPSVAAKKSTKPK